MPLQSLALVFVGAGLGGVARFATYLLLRLVWSAPPLSATFVVNVVGSLIAGCLAGPTLAFSPSSRVHLLWGIGFLGGYTTFSAFSIEILSVIEQRSLAYALGYTVLSCASAIFASFLGVVLTTKLS